MQIIKDVISFLKSLSFTDYIFFFAVLALMLLIISFIYFIFNNQTEDMEIDLPADENSNDEIISLEHEDEQNAIMDLRELSDIKSDESQDIHMINDYETEQEEKAIISYDELLKRKKDYAINYSEEENLDEDLSVKKVDLDHLVNKNIEIKSDVKATVISYEKEEAFLEALKTLQKKLN